ncbi:MAG: MarR family transcriptional regulator [Gemmatimonadetes bacterium]|nr:MarR family transcriptional regulator [Gemmatimonadota bacterium]
MGYDTTRAAADGRDTDTTLALKLFVVLARAEAAVERHAAADVARHGLTLSEFAVLEALFHKGPLLLGDVQRKVLVSSGGITYLVDRLEQKGLVERRPCTEDRRAVWAALTPAGDALIRRIFPEHEAALRAALGALSEDEKRTAIGLLRRLGRHAAEIPLPSGNGG